MTRSPLGSDFAFARGVVREQVGVDVANYVLAFIVLTIRRLDGRQVHDDADRQHRIVDNRM